MLRVEFHCHTIYSPDSLTPPEKLVQVCKTKGIDRVVVTDHNSIKGALEAQRIDPDLVIIGEEIMTTRGEILAAFVQEEIPSGLDPEVVIQRLREQKAFISLSHPFDIHRSGHWNFSDLQEIASQVDAIEVFNARCLLRKYNQQAQDFANSQGLPGTAGSDAHAAFELGRATLLVPEFSTAETLRAVIASGQVHGSLSQAWVHLASRYAAWKKGTNSQN